MHLGPLLTVTAMMLLVVSACSGVTGPAWHPSTEGRDYD